MSLSILANTTAIARLVSTTISPTGGTAPYTFEVLPEGAGGSIDANGKYTAPNNVGLDVIRVTDNVGETQDLCMRVLEPLKLLCDVIATELGLDSDQVYIYNTKFTIPEDERMYISLAILSEKLFGNNNKQADVAGNFEEIQSSFHAVTLQIDIMSRTTEAMDRKNEVFRALKSTYSQRQQELNSIGIGRLPTSINAINVGDGAAIPYRFSASVVVHYMEFDSKDTAYYDDFSQSGPQVITDPQTANEPIDVDIT